MNLVRLEPAYQHYVWGGGRIPHYFSRPLPEGLYAESWEVSDRIEGMSHIGNGPWKGKPLKDLLSSYGRGTFPLLIKIIDSREHLSIQVHPNEKAALQFKGNPKSEAWVALEPTVVYAGFQSGVTAKDFKEAMLSSNVASLLREISLAKGEAIYIPAGQVHSICQGALLLEVQQNSNTTYRLYDWGRIGRELHLKEGCASIDWTLPPVQKSKRSLIEESPLFQRSLLISSPYFTIEQISIKTTWTLPSSPLFQILFCTEGNVTLEEESMSRGSTYLVMPNCPSIQMVGESQILLIQEK